MRCYKSLVMMLICNAKFWFAFNDKPNEIKHYQDATNSQLCCMEAKKNAHIFALCKAPNVHDRCIMIKDSKNIRDRFMFLFNLFIFRLIIISLHFTMTCSPRPVSPALLATHRDPTPSPSFRVHYLCYLLCSALLTGCPHLPPSTCLRNKIHLWSRASRITTEPTYLRPVAIQCVSHTINHVIAIVG